MLEASHLELATKYMYFNLDRKLFQTLEFKEDIKNLFNKYWFSEISHEIQQIQIKEESDILKFNTLLYNIKEKDKNLFYRLFHYPLQRSGNGEVLLYLFLENSYLSSSSTSGRDIIINDTHYEIKNCTVSKKYKTDQYFYSNFKLGNSFCIRNIINNIENYFNYIPRGSEIAAARVDSVFLQIESEYREIVYREYFSKHRMIFIDKEGIIKFIGKVQKEDIFIDTITEGTIKPMIKI